MQKFLLLLLFLFISFACNTPPENKESQTTDTEETDIVEVEEEIEETYSGLQDGYYSVPSEIRTHLRTFCNYNVNTNQGDFEYVSISKDANGAFTKSCEYDAVGSYLINTDENVDQTFIASNGYPFLEHSYHDTNIYLIEEINISGKGSKIAMKVRYMSFDNNSGYYVDMAVATEKVDLMINEANQLVLVDRTNTNNPRYFMELKLQANLPNPECDEDYR